MIHVLLVDFVWKGREGKEKIVRCDWKRLSSGLFWGEHCRVQEGGGSRI